MNEGQIKEHYSKADEVVRQSIAESKKNFERITDIIQQKYDEINKGEIIVTTGAFSLIITFLIQSNKDAHYSYPLYLKFAICFLFFVIIWKFHLNRSSAKRAEQERDLTEKYLELVKKIQVANTEFLIKGDSEKLSKTPKIFEEIDAVESRRRSMNSTLSKKIGSFMNEIEYVAFFIGTDLLLIFFLFNIK